MNRKNLEKLIEINQQTKRKNIYTNQCLNDSNQNLNFFSYFRPLSAEEPYQQTRRSSQTYLRSSQKSKRSPKPMKIGKFQPQPEENIRLYFDEHLYEYRQKSHSNPKPTQARSSQKNIYIRKKINTSYGKGNFRANYRNLFMEYPYKSQEKSKEKEEKKDLYCKYKTKAPFKPSGKVKKAITEQNELYQNNIANPYQQINEQNLFRSKSPTNNFISRFQWKPTTQFVKKMQSFDQSSKHKVRIG